jgi:hypothetical protein
MALLRDRGGNGTPFLSAHLVREFYYLSFSMGTGSNRYQKCAKFTTADDE